MHLFRAITASAGAVATLMAGTAIATAADVSFLTHWSPETTAKLEAAAAEGFPELFRFRDRAYAFYLVWVSEYLHSMRQRSRKWETVSLPAADYRRLRRPLDQLLNVTSGTSLVAP